ncbi:MAG: YceI family protein [Chitinophagaceae bacterium]|nr:YceI family protein [Chitinophagaceae bacterium]MCW5905310.1 YceI family protein [Chitinophagaceae bacterium]
MKKILLLSAVFAGSVGLYSFMPSTKNVVANEYKVNTEKSKIDWIGSKKSGYHPGSFMLKEGSVQVEGNQITGGQFVIDMSGLKVLDAAGPKLEGHLKNADFFEVEKFPTASFTINSVNYTTETDIEIEGVLTLKGVEVPLKFPGVIRGVSEKALFAQAFFTLDSRLLPITDKYSNADVPLSIHLFANM